LTPLWGRQIVDSRPWQAGIDQLTPMLSSDPPRADAFVPCSCLCSWYASRKATFLLGQVPIPQVRSIQVSSVPVLSS